MSRLHMLSTVGTLLIVLALFSDVTYAQCPKVRLRKSLSQLSQGEWDALNRGMLALKANGQLDRLTKVHRSGMQYHGTPYFFPMHRALMVDFENELLRVAPTLTGVPYWDELHEGADIAKSNVFTLNRLSPIVSGPLRGIFAGLKDDSQKPVIRSPQNVPTTFNWLPPNAVMARALERFANFGDFSRVVEVSPHNQFHVVVGGHMGNPSTSPSDPTFWVHHAYIDLLWALWQSLRPQNRENLQAWGASRPGINPSEPVALYPNRWTNRDMLLYRSRLCYQYTMPTTRETRFKRRSTYYEENNDASRQGTQSEESSSDNGITSSTTSVFEWSPTPTPTSSVPINETMNACPSTSQYPTPYFKRMWEAPAEAVGKVMPNMTLADWRKVECELNQAIEELNYEIASGQVKPENLPDIQSLFYKAGMNCSKAQTAGDNYEDSLIPEVQQLAAENHHAELTSSSTGSMIEHYGALGVFSLVYLMSTIIAG